MNVTLLYKWTTHDWRHVGEKTTLHNIWADISVTDLPDIHSALRWVHTCNVAAYRNTVSWVWTGLVTTLRIKSWLCGNVTSLFGVLSVFGRRIKAMIRLRSVQVWTCNVTSHVHICSGRNRIILLTRRPNTDSTPNKPLTLPRNQLLIRYAVTSPVHTVTIWCYDTR
jgi:hypothetical protein